jgi:hypothetical protein
MSSGKIFGIFTLLGVSIAALVMIIMIYTQGVKCKKDKIAAGNAIIYNRQHASKQIINESEEQLPNSKEEENYDMDDNFQETIGDHTQLTDNQRKSAKEQYDGQSVAKVLPPKVMQALNEASDNNMFAMHDYSEEEKTTANALGVNFQSFKLTKDDDDVGEEDDDDAMLALTSKTAVGMLRGSDPARDFKFVSKNLRDDRCSQLDEHLRESIDVPLSKSQDQPLNATDAWFMAQNAA